MNLIGQMQFLIDELIISQFNFLMKYQGPSLIQLLLGWVNMILIKFIDNASGCWLLQKGKGNDVAWAYGEEDVDKW